MQKAKRDIIDAANKNIKHTHTQDSPSYIPRPAVQHAAVVCWGVCEGRSRAMLQPDSMARETKQRYNMAGTQTCFRVKHANSVHQTGCVTSHRITHIIQQQTAAKHWRVEYKGAAAAASVPHHQQHSGSTYYYLPHSCWVHPRAASLVRAATASLGSCHERKLSQSLSHAL